MKGQADMKDKPTQWEMWEGNIESRDNTITLFMEWYSTGCKDIDALIDRIRQEGLANLKIMDFYTPLENLARWVFVEMIDGIDDVFGWASDKFISMYPEIRFKYERKLFKLSRAIKERSPGNQQAQQLAAAIDRLIFEVTDALQRGIDQYLHGKGKPQPNDLLTDERHGALWDRVENAIIALSTPQAEPADNKAWVQAKADICAEVAATAEKTQGMIVDGEKKICRELRTIKGKRNANDMKQTQRERAANWLKDINADKPKDEWLSIEDAARQFGNEIEAEKGKGGYATVEALRSALYRQAKELGIAQYKTSKAGRPRKQ